MLCLKWIAIAAISALPFGCGGGGSGSTSNGSTSSSTDTNTGGNGTSGGNTGTSGGQNGTSSTTAQSTALISSYASTQHSLEISAVNSSLPSVESTAAATGEYGSGNMAYAMCQSKESYVQTFLSGVVSYVRSTKASYPIDNQSIVSMLSTYQSQDLSWTSTVSVSGVAANWFTTMSAAAGYANSINSAYSAAVTQINSI